MVRASREHRAGAELSRRPGILFFPWIHATRETHKEMTQTTRIIVAAALTGLSACESEPAPRNSHGLYINAGAALAKIRLAVPCQSPYQCGLSPILPFEENHALGFELGAGYRFT